MKRFISLIIIIFCLTACQNNTQDRIAPTLDNNSYTLYFMRHAEKGKMPKNDPPLVAQGKQRAEQLALLLADVKLSKIYSTDYQRTQQTAAPTAKAQGIQVTSYNPRDLPAFAKRLVAQQQTALIIGHSNTTPTLVGLTGGIEKKISESQFGDLFKLTINKNDLSDVRFEHLIVNTYTQ